MTTLHHKRPGEVTESDPAALLATIEAFLSGCRRPAALEYGEKVIPLTPGCYALEVRSGRLLIEIWDETRSLSRRILATEAAGSGLLDCSIQKFGGKPGRLTFLDLDRPQTAHRSLRGIRQNFTEQFRLMLARQFPGWEIPILSSGLDLRRSFSSIFPRARLTRGSRQIAAMACPAAQNEAELLAFALIWHDHLSLRRRAKGETPLCLFLPEEAGTLTAHRLRWLSGECFSPRLFRFNEHGSAGEVDPRDLGNLETRVSALYAAPQLTPEVQHLLARLEAIRGVGCCPELNGSISIRSRGLEFARIENGRILLGIETKREVDACHTEEVANFAAVAGANSPPRFPERWFESAVRSNITAIDPDLLTSPVHGQVITFAAGDRDLIDLLACSPSGRLAVLELKTSEDLQLPIQALDYWMRVTWHAQRQELRPLFPGVSLEQRPPKLLLVAPAMSFHSSTAALLRYFSPEVEVERVGVNSDWQTSLKVVLRLRGADLPISHGSSE
ncbi:MAG TPA: hypothetical protein VGL97_17195 [Bryobacteraceae bacterium]